MSGGHITTMDYRYYLCFHTHRPPGAAILLLDDVKGNPFWLSPTASIDVGRLELEYFCCQLATAPEFSCRRPTPPPRL